MIYFLYNKTSVETKAKNNLEDFEERGFEKKTVTI